MKITPLSFLQYAYAKYVTNLVIQREIFFIRKENNIKRSEKLIGRIKFTQLLMPSKYSTDYNGALPTYLDNSIHYDETVYYYDRHNKLQNGDDEKDGTKGFIQKVHFCCEEYLPLLENLKKELHDKLEENLSQNEKQNKRKELISKIHDIIKKYFINSCTKETFVNLELTEKVILTQIKTDLFPKELFLYQSSILVKKICELDASLETRLQYKLKKTKTHFDIIGYREAKREISKYESSLKKRKVPDNYNSFRALVNMMFTELDSF